MHECMHEANYATITELLCKATYWVAPDGEPINTFDIKLNGTVQTTLRFSPDGRALDYTVVNNNVGNIWRQPLTGGPPKQITDFKDKLISTFNWAHDNKLICTRGVILRDAVLISDAK